MSDTALSSQHRILGTRRNGRLQRGALCVHLDTLRGENSDDVITTTGYWRPNDGGGGTFCWHPEATDEPDNGLVFGSQERGRWRRERSSSSFQASWWGIVGDNATDNAAAFQRALSAMPRHCTLQLRGGRFRTTTSILLRAGQTLQGVLGAGAGTASPPDGTAILYTGPSNTDEGFAVVQAVGESRVRNLQIAVGNPSARVTALLGFNYRAGSDATPTAPLFENVLMSGILNHGGTADYCCVVGSGGSGGNFENVIWRRCAFFNARVAGVRVLPSQPFNLEFDHCVWYGHSWCAAANAASVARGGAGGSIAYGTGILWEANAYGSLSLSNPVFSYVALAIKYNGPTVFTTVRDADVEGIKRIFERVGVFGGVGDPLLFSGGRWNTVQLDKPVYFDDGTLRYAASDHLLGIDDWGSQMEFSACDFTVGSPSHTVMADARFRIMEQTSVNFSSCLLPNTTPVWRVTRYNIPGSGGTYIRGCRWFTRDASTGHARVPDRDGCENPAGSFSVAGDEVEVVVSLGQQEHRVAPSGQTFYDVSLSVQESYGEVMDGAFVARVVSKSPSSFVVRLSSPPGQGASVKYAFRLSLKE